MPVFRGGRINGAGMAALMRIHDDADGACPGCEEALLPSSVVLLLVLPAGTLPAADTTPVAAAL
jgi:hypothetical protein